jgi:organic radical activating enzyme
MTEPATVSYNDVNASPSLFTSEVELLVSSYFYTLQGEMPFAGTPSVFVRLAGCHRGDKLSPAGCSFGAYGCCDADFRLSQASRLSPASLVSHWLPYVAGLPQNKGKPLPLLVITGGEPLLQPLVKDLIEATLDAHYLNRVQIETTGDYLPEYLYLLMDKYSSNKLQVSGQRNDPRLFVVMSPKAGFGGKRWPAHRKQLSFFHKYPTATFFRVLVSADPSTVYNEIHPLVQELESVQRLRYFTSPIAAFHGALQDGDVPSFWNHERTDVPNTKASYIRAADLALKHGCRMSVQSHQLIDRP